MATHLGMSRTTVSEALRDHPRVNPETRTLVQAHAREVGYQFNPLASSVLSEVRRTRLDTFRGVLATIGLEEPARVPFLGAYWHDLQRGAAERAEQLGFKLEKFIVGERGVSVQRLDTILRTRGIRGVLIMPAWNRPDFTQLSWTNYSGIYADYLIDQPALHTVCPDHPRAMGLAMRRVQELGYKRPGLALIEQESNRLDNRWLAAFLAYAHLHPELTPPAPLIMPQVSAELFKKWFRKYKPDVVIGHRAEMIKWMQECGARVPETHGFCSVNIGLNTGKLAGLDLQPRRIGERAIDMLISQIHHNFSGIPDLPCNTTVPALWADGPTLRAQK
ncbi:LacI family transcriptional regulator [Oleiharenicola lentus]|uniref:LacI family transcriptional regulator n=1 Tax=Oleiharenicola lentus TaxID=2508720 RepID=UPI003F67CEC1